MFGNCNSPQNLYNSVYMYTAPSLQCSPTGKPDSMHVHEQATYTLTLVRSFTTSLDLCISAFMVARSELGNGWLQQSIKGGEKKKKRTHSTQ